jgi:hypothetical protein
MSQLQCLNGHATQTALPTNSNYWRARAEELESQLNGARHMLVKLAEALPVEYLHYLNPLSLEPEADSTPGGEPQPAADQAPAPVSEG